MISIKILRAIFFTIVCVCILAIVPTTFCQQPAPGANQTRQAQRDDDTNLDTQLYLILATNRDVEDGKMPAALEPIIKRLRESLPFKHYTLAGTFLNRVKNFGHLDVSWVGGPFMNASAVVLGSPSFNEFGAVVTLGTDSDGEPIVRMKEFRFGAKVPIVMARAGTPTNASTAQETLPIVYETVGLHTDLSMREGAPVIAGTLHVGPSGDAIVVAISARRAN